MKKLLIASCIALAACTPPPAVNPKAVDLQENLANPLFAERYAEEKVKVLTELYIQKDPLIEKASIKRDVDSLREQWLERANEAEQLQRTGTKGSFFEAAVYANGSAVMFPEHLHFSSTFDTLPGGDVWVYLSTVVDPRGLALDELDAIELGPLQSPYGAQTYSLATPLTDEQLIAYRTIVLWDKVLGRVHAFGQLSPSV